MKKIINFIIIFVCIPFVASASIDGVTGFVKETSEKTLFIVENNELSTSEKEKKLNSLFEESMDIGWMSTFVMGRYWRELTKEQKVRYKLVYKKFIINSYVPKFKDYTDQKFKFKKVFVESDNEYLVQTEIQKPGNAPIRIDYRVRKQENGEFYIYDIIAEGVSLITTQRSDFGSILLRKGADYLIEKLEDRANAY